MSFQFSPLSSDSSLLRLPQRVAIASSSVKSKIKPSVLSQNKSKGQLSELQPLNSDSTPSDSTTSANASFSASSTLSVDKESLHSQRPTQWIIGRPLLQAVRQLRIRKRCGEEAKRAQAWMRCRAAARDGDKASFTELIKFLFPLTEKEKPPDTDAERPQPSEELTKQLLLQANKDGAIDIAEALAQVCHGDVQDAQKVWQRLTQPLDMTQNTEPLESEETQSEQTQIEEKAWRCAQQLAQARGDGLRLLLQLQEMDPQANIAAGTGREAAFAMYLQAGHKLQTFDKTRSALPTHQPEAHLLGDAHAKQALVAMTAARKIAQRHSAPFDLNQLTPEEITAYKTWQWGWEDSLALKQAAHLIFKTGTIYVDRAHTLQKKQSRVKQAAVEIKKMGGWKQAAIKKPTAIKEYCQAYSELFLDHFPRAFNKRKTPFRTTNGLIGADTDQTIDALFLYLRDRFDQVTDASSLAQTALNLIKLYTWQRTMRSGHPERFTVNQSIAKGILEQARALINTSQQADSTKEKARKILEQMEKREIKNLTGPTSRLKFWQTRHFFKLAEIKALADELPILELPELPELPSYLGIPKPEPQVNQTLKESEDTQLAMLMPTQRVKQASEQVAQEQEPSEQLYAKAVKTRARLALTGVPLKEISAHRLREHAKDFLNLHPNGNTYQASGGSELGVDLGWLYPLSPISIGPHIRATGKRLVSYEISSDKGGSQLSFGQMKEIYGHAGIGGFLGLVKLKNLATVGVSLGASPHGQIQSKKNIVLRSDKSIETSTHVSANNDEDMIDHYWDAIEHSKNSTQFLDELTRVCFDQPHISLVGQQAQSTQGGFYAALKAGAYLQYKPTGNSIGLSIKLRWKWSRLFNRPVGKNGAWRSKAQGQGNENTVDMLVSSLGFSGPYIDTQNDTLQGISKEWSRSLWDRHHYSEIQEVRGNPQDPIPTQIQRKVKLQNTGFFGPDRLLRQKWAQELFKPSDQLKLNQLKRWPKKERGLIAHWKLTDSALKDYQRFLKDKKLLEVQQSTTTDAIQLRQINARLAELSKKLKKLEKEPSAWVLSGFEAYRKTNAASSSGWNWLFVANHKHSEAGISDRLWLPVKDTEPEAKHPSIENNNTNINSN